jgi:predicted dehydrogenase
VLNFVLYGCGFVGEKHIAAISHINQAYISAIIDCNVARKKIADSLCIPFYRTFDEFKLNHPVPDVVNICTPNGYHIRHAEQALLNGSNVVIEKPMGLIYSHCDQLNRFAASNNLKVFCVLQNRYSPPIVWLKSLVQMGILGRVFLVTVRCFWNRDDRYYTNNWRGKLALDGGPLYTQFSHFIDVLYFLFGMGKNYSAKFFNFNHRHNTEFEDSGIVNFEFEHEIECNLQYSTSVWDSNLESSLTIIAEKGSIIIGGQYMNSVELCKVKDYDLPSLPPSPPPNKYPGYTGSANNHLPIFENVVRALTSNDRSGIDGTEGANVVKMIEDIYKLR